MNPKGMGDPEAEEKTQFVDSCNFLCISKKKF
jgi:hypothetical protein